MIATPESLLLRTVHKRLVAPGSGATGSSSCPKKGGVWESIGERRNKGKEAAVTYPAS
jgi:hypothetical protein